MEAFFWIGTIVLSVGIMYVLYRVLTPDPLMEVPGEEENVPHIDVYTTIGTKNTLYSDAFKNRVNKNMPLLEDADRRTYKRKAPLSDDDGLGFPLNLMATDAILNSSPNRSYPEYSTPPSTYSPPERSEPSSSPEPSYSAPSYSPSPSYESPSYSSPSYSSGSSSYDSGSSYSSSSDSGSSSSYSSSD